MAQQYPPQQPQQRDFREDEYIPGSGTYDVQEQELLKLQLDVNDLLSEFEHRVLRGEYEFINKDTGEKDWKLMAVNGKPIINEIGIREVIARMIGYVNKATKLSSFTDEDIYKDMFYFDMSLSELIAKRSGLWELDIETAKAIKDSVIELVKSIVFSARNGFTAINLKSQYSKQDITRNEPQQSQSKGGFLGLLGKK